MFVCIDIFVIIFVNKQRNSCKASLSGCLHEYTRKRKILEALYIKSINPSLNEQLDTELLGLFRNGVT